MIKRTSDAVHWALLAALAFVLTMPVVVLAQEEDPPGPPPERLGPPGPMLRGERRGGPDGGPGGPLGPEAIPMTERLKVLRDLRPDAADRYEEIRQRHPEQAREFLERARNLDRLVLLKRQDPQAYELEVRDRRLDQQCVELVEQIRQGKDEPQTQALRDKLKNLVAEHFQVRQEKRERELAKLQERIEELRKSLEERKTDKDQIIQQRVDELMQRTRSPVW